MTNNTYWNKRRKEITLPIYTTRGSKLYGFELDEDGNRMADSCVYATIAQAKKARKEYLKNK